MRVLAIVLLWLFAAGFVFELYCSYLAFEKGDVAGGFLCIFFATTVVISAVTTFLSIWED